MTNPMSPSKAAATDDTKIPDLSHEGLEVGLAPYQHAAAAMSARTYHAQLHQELTHGFHGPNMAGAVLDFMILMDQLPRQLNEPISEADFALAYRLNFDIDHGELFEMRVAFDKLRRAQTMENLTEFADGCIDSIYVILWMMLKFNLPVAALFNEVQRSNMAKRNADGAITKVNGKVQKPADWTPPDLMKILIDHFDQAEWNGNIRVHNKPL